MRTPRERAEMSYPVGTRIEMLYSSDPFDPIPPGTRGTVALIDDGGTLHMKWDNGRTLGLIVGEDSFRVVGMACPECLQEQGHKMDCSRRRT